MTHLHVGSRLNVTFLSMVHPHPWAPTKGTFNRTMLQSMPDHVDVTAIVPVPWTERIRSQQVIPDPGYRTATPTFWYLPRAAPLRLAAALNLSLARRLHRMASPLPDVVLSYWTDPDGTAALRWARRIGRPMALIVGGSDIMLLGQDPQRGPRMLDTIRGADLVLAVGSLIHDRLIAEGIDRERLRILRRGVDRSRFHPLDRGVARAELEIAPASAVLLWVGRMMPVKGLDVLIKALGDSRLREVELVLVGDGPLRPRLERQTRAAGLESQVTFRGTVPPEALPRWYAAADIVVLPSRSEGVPNVLLEAKACGRPFIASDVGAIRDVSEEPELELVPPDNPAALADRISARLAAPAPEVDHRVPDAAESGAWLEQELVELRDRWSS